VQVVPEEYYPGGPINDHHVNITLGAGGSPFSEIKPNVPKAERVAIPPKNGPR